MSIADNIKKIREEKSLLQKQVASEIGLKPAHYNKIEKGLVEPSLSIMSKLSNLYSLTIDQIVNLKDEVPKEVIFEDQTANEQLKLLSKLNDKDKDIVLSIIDTMITKQKFKDFFDKNIANL